MPTAQLLRVSSVAEADPCFEQIMRAELVDRRFAAHTLGFADYIL
jgi:hypothetical protein